MHVVYEALTEDGRSAYVGVTSHLASRIRTHRCTALWFMAVAEWRVLAEFEDRAEAERYEWNQIGARRPLFNKRANPDAGRASLSEFPVNPKTRIGGPLGEALEALRLRREAERQVS